MGIPRLLLIGVVGLLAACKSDPVTLELSGETMGTTYNIVAVDKSAELKTDRVQQAVEDALAAVNAGMSNWDPNSEISRFNKASSTDPIEISPELAHVMQAAMTVHRESDGRFDVTLGPLIELWGFGARTPESPVPSDTAIEAALEVVGQDKTLTLAKGAPATLQKTLPETSVYLAAIAKGYGVDQVSAALAELGLSDYMVEIGGDLYASGNNPDGQNWKIGIERPDAATRTVEEIVRISGLGMATSGDYRNYFEQDGVRYSHIIDGRTGRPITHTTASVTVLTEDAMMADAWATALLALGQTRGLEIAEQLDLAVYFIARDPTSDAGGFVTASSSRFKTLQSQE